MKKDHENWKVLLRYLKGELSQKELKSLKARLKSGKGLPENYKLLEALLFAIGHPDEVKNFSGVRALSSRQFREFHKGLEPGQPPYGITTFDSNFSSTSQHPRGILSPIAKDTRRLKFRINNLELILTFYPVSPESFRVEGQVLGIKGLAPVEIRLTSGREPFKSTSDEFHVFVFERIPARHCSLKIAQKDEIIGRVDFVL